MTLLQYHLLGLSLTSLSMLSFGLFLLIKGPRQSVSRSMALYCFSVAWWSGWECAALLAPTKEVAFLRMRVEYIGVAFIPTLLLATVFSFLDIQHRTQKRVLLPLALASLLTLIPATFMPTKQFLWFTPGSLFYLPVWGQAGPYYWLFMVFFFGTIIAAHTLLMGRWIRSHGEQRALLSLFMIGSLMAYLGGCPEFALKYGVRLGWLNPFGLYCFPIYIAVLTYAVAQHHLFDVDLVVRKSLVYSVLVTLLTISYFGIIYVVEQLFQYTLGYKSFWISLGAFALMALLFQPLKITIQKVVDWLLFRARQEGLIKRMERLEEQVLQAEKFKAVSTLAAGMAHEIKNPLTAIKTFIDFIPEKEDDREFIRKLHDVLAEETARIQTLVQDVLSFSKPKAPQLKPLDIGPLISSTMDLLSSELLKRRIAWTVDCSHNGASLRADKDQLRQVLLNLIQNAADAMPEGGKLVVRTAASDGHLELSISDNGDGIPEELLPKIFDPFISTKPTGNGLGLAVVYSIIQSHHGTIRVDSHPGTGTTFIVSLPI